MKFRKKLVFIEATQWFKNGDHPQDQCVPVRRKGLNQSDVTPLEEYTGELVPDPTTGAPSFLSEGKVVRYYRYPGDRGDRLCEWCGLQMQDHGWIDMRNGGSIVCPGDWVITDRPGVYRPCKPDLFAETYEPCE